MKKDTFQTRLKKAMDINNIKQIELVEKTKISKSLINQYLSGLSNAKQDKLTLLADALNVNEVWLMGYDVPSDRDYGRINIKKLHFDNAQYIELQKDVIQIPVLGYIKAGLPIEMQEDIVDYVTIPKSWTKGNKKFFALKISGNSMETKYKENDIIIFEQTNDFEYANNKDCAVSINCTECVFKNFKHGDNGITLISYNTDYTPMFFDKEQAVMLPISILGIARKKISDIV